MEIAWTSGGFTPNASAFADESQRVRTVVIHRGKDDELSDLQPSQAVLSMQNVDGRFNVQSTQTNIGPSKSVRITAAPGDDTATGYGALWYGFTETITPTWRKEIGTAQIECVDALARFALTKTTRTDASNVQPAQVIANALNDARYPGGTSLQVTGAVSAVGPGRDLTTANQALAAMATAAVWSNTPVLDQLRTVQENENLGAMIFVARDGKVTNHGGARRTAQTTADFVMDLNASDIWDYQEVISAREVANYVRVTHTGGGAASAADSATSQVLYGVRELNVNSTFRTSAQAATLAGKLNTAHKDPALRPIITIRNHSSDLLRHILRRELGDQVKLTIASASGAPHKHFYIEGMHLTFEESGAFAEARYQLTERALTI